MYRDDTQLTPDDEKQLGLLATLSIVFAVLCVLCHSIFLFYVWLGIELTQGREPFAIANSGIHPDSGWMWVAIGSVAVLAGWVMGALNVMAATRFRNREGYVFLTVVAAINCLNMPFGAALGIFTLFVINRESVKLALQGRQRNLGAPPK